jgi:preprotein translocase subunit SecA
MDPLIEYKREGYQMFSMMMGSIKEQVIPVLLRIEHAEAEREPAPAVDLKLMNLKESRPEFNVPGSAETAQAQAEAPMGAKPSGPKNGAVQPMKRQFPKVGRNDLCPCGSGKKYKKCHGATAS